MGAIATSKSEDLRTVAEQQEGIIASPQSKVAMPEAYIFSAEEFSRIEYSPTITYTGADTERTITELLSNQSSTMGRLLNLTERLAGGIFEKSSDIMASVAAQSAHSTESWLASSAQGLPAGTGIPITAGPTPAAGDKVLIIVAFVIGVGLLLSIRRRR